MCLITEQKKPIKIRKDLTVYKKVLYDGFRISSPIQDFMWELNKLYQTELKDSYMVRYYGEFVYDYYLEGYQEYPGDLYTFCKNKGYRTIGKGFHSFNSFDTYKKFEGEIDSCVKCTIPKGSLIFKDKTGLIVSNQIILKEVIK